MMENTITASFSLTADDTLLGTQWIRLSQIFKEDTATKSELAALLDRIYGVTPCTVSADDAKPATPSVFDNTEGKTDLFAPSVASPVTKQEFNDIVLTTFPLPICDLFEDGSYNTRVRVVMNNPFGSYTIRLTNGKVTGQASVVRRVIKYTVAVEEEVGVLLDYPFIADPRVTAKFEWINPPVSKTKGFVEPEIEMTSGVLNWGERVTGSLTLEYMTQYDEVPVLVFGTPSGERGESQCVGFYEGLQDNIDLEAPEYEEPEDPQARFDFCPNSGFSTGSGGSLTVNKGDAKCYWMEKKEYFCECSGKFAFYGPEEKVYVDCPEGGGKCTTSDDCEKDLGNRVIDGGFTDKCNERDEVNDPEYYKEKCCEAPPKDPPLPKCKERKSGNATSGSLDADTIKKYKSKYKNVRFVGVRPEEGCGDITYRQVIPSRACCDHVLPLELDKEKSGDVIADNSDLLLVTNKGRMPLTWKAVSKGLYFDSARTTKEITTVNGWATVFSTDVCGPLNVTVTDDCTELSIQIRATTGTWEEREPSDYDMQIDSTQLIARRDVIGCGRWYGRWQGFEGKWKAEQNYYSASKSDTNFYSDDCSGVSDDYKNQADEAEGESCRFIDGEKELIRLNTLMASVWPPPDYYIYNWESGQPDDIWIIPGDNKYGYNQWKDDGKCSTMGIVVCGCGSRSTFPELWEWVC